MRVGGPADRCVVARDTEELIAAVVRADRDGTPVLLVGGGSNLLVADEGFPGTAIRVASVGFAVESADPCSGVTVRAAAGHDWDDLVRHAVEQGWAGIEALSGIPGTVGSTPIQNVGAYGQEVAQTIARVHTWDRAEGRVCSFAASECGFAYRDSLFKGTDRYVVLEVTFQLDLAGLSRPIVYADLAHELGVNVGERLPSAQVRQAVLAQRRDKGMVLDPADHDTWSCGSFFTNPVLTVAEHAGLSQRAEAVLGPGVTPPGYPAPDGLVKTSAAWLIERAGFAKGYGQPGPAALSGKHTLAVTNRGHAKAADVIALARVVRDGVRDTFGVELTNEPVLVGLSL